MDDACILSRGAVMPALVMVQCKGNRLILKFLNDINALDLEFP